MQDAAFNKFKLDAFWAAADLMTLSQDCPVVPLTAANRHASIMKNHVLLIDANRRSGTVVLPCYSGIDKLGLCGASLADLESKYEAFKKVKGKVGAGVALAGCYYIRYRTAMFGDPIVGDLKHLVKLAGMMP